MIKDKKKKYKKVSAPSNENNTKQKKGSVLQDEEKTKKKKTNTTVEWKWEDKEKPMTKKECTLEACWSWSWPNTLWYISNGYRNEWSFRNIVTETDRFAKQKGCNFETTQDKMKAFVGINFIMGINKLPSLEDYWLTDM